MTGIETQETAKNSIVSDVESDATLVSEGNMGGPSQGKEEQFLLSSQPESDSDQGPLSHSHPDAPNRPPPVPPRPTPEVDRQQQLKEEVEIGAQQDVTEVINNVLFQSQCAIKPRNIAEDGEQVDQIKE